jgi:DNA polymerase-3 subunit delta'
LKFDKVIGQEEAKQRLQQLVDEQRIPHALMFTGPEGCGKMALALAFASFLLGERWNGKSLLSTPSATANAEAMLAQWQHPDLHFSYPVIKSKGAGSDSKITSEDFFKGMAADVGRWSLFFVGAMDVIHECRKPAGIYL